MCVINPLVSSTNQIYEFNWPMTLGELLHDKTLLVIFYFLNNAPRSKNNLGVTFLSRKMTP